MAMKISILFLLVATNLLVAVKCDTERLFYTELAGNGFRVKVPTFTGLLAVGVNGGLYRDPFDATSPFQRFAGQAFFRSDGYYVYENRDIVIGPNDKAYVALALQIENDGQRSVEIKVKAWNVPADATRID